MKHLSGNSKQQVIADGNPYLRVYCILAGYVEGPLAMKVAEQLLEIHISLIHEVVIAWLYGYEAHSLGVMDCSLRQINKCGNRSPQIQQGMHLYTTFIMMKSCPWTELQAKFHRTAVEGIDDSVHIESGRLFAVQVSRLCNQYLTEVVIDPPIPGSVNMCQSRALDIFDSGSVQLGGRGCKTPYFKEYSPRYKVEN